MSNHRELIRAAAAEYTVDHTPGCIADDVLQALKVKGLMIVPKHKGSYRIKSLVPPPPHTKNLEQCSVYTGDNSIWSSSSWTRRAVKCQKKGWHPKFCTKGAGIEIDGKPYCRQHAGAIAIDILLGRK